MYILFVLNWQNSVYFLQNLVWIRTKSIDYYAKIIIRKVPGSFMRVGDKDCGEKIAVSISVFDLLAAALILSNANNVKKDPPKTGGTRMPGSGRTLG
ncbi:hypothetical protein [Desulfotruncus arcticus]|nr:hypothetical protein [Desulfotruncus arcticus]